MKNIKANTGTRYSLRKIIRDIYLAFSCVIIPISIIIPCLLFSMIHPSNSDSTQIIGPLVLAGGFCYPIFYYFYQFKTTIVTLDEIIVKRLFFPLSSRYKIKDIGVWEEFNFTEFRFGSDKLLVLYYRDHVIIGKINSLYNQGYPVFSDYIKNSFDRKINIDLNYSNY